MLFICEQASANVECSWVVDLGASFHLIPKRECFSSYTVDDYGYVRMGNDGEGCGHRKCVLVNIYRLQVNVKGCMPCSGCLIEFDIDCMTRR